MAYNLNYCITEMVLCFFFIVLVLPSKSAFLCEDSSDCNTLLKFKEELTSDPEGHLQTWNEANPFCNWTGITCHQRLQNRVIGLELIDMGLQGRISPFISNLSLLTNLSLQSNRFHGQIPSSLGILKDLAFLNLSSNKLEGSIPGSLHGCQSLKVIDLTYNNLSGVLPKELGWVKNLTYLALSVNSLSGVLPASLLNLTELTQLELAVNYFTGKIPPELGALRKLEILYLHTNYLEGSIPAVIGNCTALREITLIENMLNGEIPSDLFAKLKNMQKMYMSRNKLSGSIPVTLSNLSQLILFDVSLNNLEGQVPAGLGKLENLENFYLHSNNLGGGSGNSSLSFLTALTNCSYLQKLHLGSCLFTGNLPSSIGDLSKDLYYLNLFDNHITGSIPDSLGNLSGLVTLYLSYNSLEGKTPSSLGKLSNLQRLYLGNNRIIGPMPDDLGMMSNLGVLEFGNNSIGGPIPPSLGNLSQLRYLYLSRNRLSGKFPIELTQCSLIMLLDLSFNNLQGSVPVQIDRFSNLALSLNLSNNNFEGQLPASIGKLVFVQAIDLSGNQFSGSIPTLMGSCISLAYLNMSNNIFEGTIPESLKLITQLEVLDLSLNRLNGSIPIWIAKAQMIKNLNLSYNRLSGEVPDTGRIKSFNRSSFLGNVGLCGGSALLGRPPCEVQKQRSKIKKSILYSLVAAVALVCVLVAVFVYCFFFFRKRDSKPEHREHGMLRVMGSPSHRGSRTFTQRELEIATGEFNEAHLLGRGTFGTVYKAIVDDGDTIMAVKVLHGDSIQSYKSFKRECQIMSEIKHRNLVRMVGYTWNTQFKALILEYVGNGNLAEHLYPGGLEEGACELTLWERLSIAIDVANGLEYLQEGCPVQILHCDLKPENVLIDNDMVAHVADFGIGKLISADKSNELHVSTTHFLRGSIGYIPPEYGQGNEVSTKGDIYSFGVMVLELITRKRPTSNMFPDEVDLRNWVHSSYPDHVLDVVDSALKEIKSTEGALQELERCCIQMLDVGLMCTEDTPQERPSMSFVVQKLTQCLKSSKFM
ncbi:putative receptor-like protein kinase At3g47110 [Rosa rugosa]|uniref:putative receptor-like protein kinase At3g47110 n=1 Tax=Rosa rugosa TaxID=74645 RepID=UPI002B416B05|nr:putative receptor-like protein kinase At3g47110 [Rosa rugosa]